MANDKKSGRTDRSRSAWLEQLRPLVPMALISAASVCLVLGLLLPSLEFRRFFVMSDHYSLYGVVAALLEDGEFFLGVVLGAFSIVFPAAKLLVLAALAFGRASGRHTPGPAIRLAAALGRWSMLDVLVLALVVFAIKQSGLASAASLPGIWFFAAAVILSIIAARILETGKPPT